MSFTSLQGATIIAAHAAFTKALLSFTLRTYQYFEWDAKRRSSIESNKHIQQFQKAQINESEYAALLVSIFLYLSVTGNDASQAATASVVGQIGYVWMRALVGYPALPTISLAVVRYGGLALAVSELVKAAF
jgi:hypothetical protein